MTSTYEAEKEAFRAWGSRVYRKIPKHVFALAAWHLANISSGEADNPGAAEFRFCQELKALSDSGLMKPPQVLAVIKAIERGKS